MKKEYICPTARMRCVHVRCQMRIYSKTQVDKTGNVDAVMDEKNDHYIGVNNDDIWGRAGDNPTVY